MPRNKTAKAYSLILNNATVIDKAAVLETHQLAMPERRKEPPVSSFLQAQAIAKRQIMKIRKMNYAKVCAF